MIRFTAALLHELDRRHGGEGDFIGHIGGDDFVVITEPERAMTIANSIRSEFDARVRDQYDGADRERGYITVLSSRQGLEPQAFEARPTPATDLAVLSLEEDQADGVE